MLPMMPAWGTDQTYPHFAVPWAFAMDTPYRWVKQIASHLGGTRTGMVVTWPKRITDAGGIRNQFHHVIDVIPTIFEAAGIPQPTFVNGIQQRPMDGVSMVYTWDKANANAPSKRKTQYFEIFGNRAIYQDGWMAVTNPVTTPWEGVKGNPTTDVMNGFRWSLYNLNEDPTETNDLAAKEPERLLMMQQLWIMEATRNNVFPLNNSQLPILTAERPGPAAGRTKFEYFAPQVSTQFAVAPGIINRSYAITADIEVPQGGANGVLVTQGGRFSGWGLYLKDGKPTFTMNLLDVERPKWQAPQALKPGKHTIVFDWKMDPQGTVVGRGGTGTFSVDGKEVAKKSLPRTQPIIWAWDETFDIGRDTGTSVDNEDYSVPFPFTGTIGKITVELGEFNRLAGGDQADDGGTLEEARSLAPGALVAAPGRRCRRPPPRGGRLSPDEVLSASCGLQRAACGPSRLRHSFRFLAISAVCQCRMTSISSRRTGSFHARARC